MIERSVASKSARSVFFEDKNDIDIFIEDSAKGYKKIYLTLFRRVFENKYNVQTVFPLGDRKTVQEEHTKHKNKGRPTLYVIDGDLYLLTLDCQKIEPGLFTLPFYCIENIFCDYSAVANALEIDDLELTENEIIEKISHHEWLEVNETLLFNLFLEYSISFHLNPDEITVSFPIAKLLSKHRKGDLDKDKVQARIDDLQGKAIALAGEAVYLDTKSKHLRNFEKLKINSLDIVCGKQYLFVLLMLRVRSCFKTTPANISMKMRIARVCDISKLLSAEKFIIS